MSHHEQKIVINQSDSHNRKICVDAFRAVFRDFFSFGPHEIENIDFFRFCFPYYKFE